MTDFLCQCGVGYQALPATGQCWNCGNALTTRMTPLEQSIARLRADIDVIHLNRLLPGSHLAVRRDDLERVLRVVELHVERKRRHEQLIKELAP